MSASSILDSYGRVMNKIIPLRLAYVVCYPVWLLLIRAKAADPVKYVGDGQFRYYGDISDKRLARAEKDLELLPLIIILLISFVSLNAFQGQTSGAVVALHLLLIFLSARPIGEISIRRGGV